MPWFKVDDKLHDHRKTRAAGVAAMGLWALAGSWCADNLTDGFIPEDVAARWDRGYRRLAGRLVDAGFWTVAVQNGEPGWQFHGWSEPGMQPTAEHVRAERAAAAERQRRAREAAKAKREAERAARDGDAPVPDESRRDSQRSNGTSHGPPDPTRPDPTRPSKPPADADGVDDLLAEWIEHCGQRPPKRVVGHVARELKSLLDEGIPYTDVRTGFAAWHAKGLHPSTIASVVHETRTAHTRTRSTTDTRVQGALDLAAELRAEEATQPPAIGA